MSDGAIQQERRGRGEPPVTAGWTDGASWEAWLRLERALQDIRDCVVKMGELPGRHHLWAVRNISCWVSDLCSGRIRLSGSDFNRQAPQRPSDWLRRKKTSSFFVFDLRKWHVYEASSRQMGHCSTSISAGALQDWVCRLSPCDLLSISIAPSRVTLWKPLKPDPVFFLPVWMCLCLSYMLEVLRSKVGEKDNGFKRNAVKVGQAEVKQNAFLQH